MSEWIVWDRKDRPVERSILIDVKFFNGETFLAQAAGGFGWAKQSQISHYRLSEQQSMEQAYDETHKEIGDSALDVQVGGDHYKKCGIQPITYIHANKIGFMEGNAIKYLSRWRDKGGVDDLKKAKHYIEMLIELEGKL